jgi:hypothetical protein
VAKKKPRTPTPPRRVQAPKTRPATRDGRATPLAGTDLAARQRLVLYGVAGAGIIALIVVVLVIVLGGGGSTSAQSAGKKIIAAGCQFRTYPELARTPHFETLNPSPPPKWNSFPPTSGRHYYQPLVFGQYSEPVPEIRAVHNLEHGAVILQYGDKVTQSDVSKITDWYRKDPNAVIVAPLPKLGKNVALTAWTRWAMCTGFNEKAANAFRSAFRYKAPEHFPPSYLNPGE